MPNITNMLVANISSTEDSSSNVPVNRSLGNPSYDSTSGQFFTYRGLAPGNTVVNVSPSNGIPNAAQVYVKNIDAANPLIVSWTPTNGASAAVIELYPGDLIVFWCKPGQVNTGITAMTLNVPGAVVVLCEYFIGG